MKQGPTSLWGTRTTPGVLLDDLMTSTEQDAPSLAQKGGFFMVSVLVSLTGIEGFSRSGVVFGSDGPPIHTFSCRYWLFKSWTGF